MTKSAITIEKEFFKDGMTIYLKRIVREDDAKIFEETINFAHSRSSNFILDYLADWIDDLDDIEDVD